MTNGVLAAVKDATGDTLTTCPWSVFSDPLIGRVLNAMPSWRAGNFAVTHPQPSQRFTDAVMHYDSADNRVACHFMALDNKQRRASK